MGLRRPNVFNAIFSAAPTEAVDWKFPNNATESCGWFCCVCVLLFHSWMDFVRVSWNFSARVQERGAAAAAIGHTDPAFKLPNVSINRTHQQRVSLLIWISAAAAMEKIVQQLALSAEDKSAGRGADWITWYGASL